MSGAEQKPSFLGSISPWNTSRSTTPQPGGGTDNREKKDGLQRSQGIDHTVTHRHHLSLRRYPKDCPPLKSRWFYAVDTPKSKPSLSTERPEEEPKPLPPPKKFVPFSVRDSQSIESAFQKLADQEESEDITRKDEKSADQNSAKVPVNEDYLFDVDVKRRELAPAYWLGPIYEVRRGTWFFQDGSGLKPCEENLATQLEEGFLKVKPWQAQYQQQQANPSLMPTPTSRPSSNSVTSDPGNSTSTSGSAGLTPKRSGVDLNRQYDQTSTDGTSGEMSSSTGNVAQSHRLFGSYMNSTATYQDSTTAWLTHDDFMSRMSSTVYQRFGGVAGTKYIRGYSETKPPKEGTDTKGAETTPRGQGKSKDDDFPKRQEPTPVNLKRKSAPPGSMSSSNLDEPAQQPEKTSAEKPRTTLERQMSSLAGQSGDAIGLEEEARKQEEKEMEDSREADGEERDRDIDHLVLVTHGIGQRLGLRLESINFVHDVNVLRKSLKTVYGASPDLQALNSEVNNESKNCRVQVLPVSWRHLLDFPKQGLKQNRKELDLADADKLSAEDELYPTLADITLEGVPAVRNLISDLAMDVLLYQSGYRGHIAGIVQKECNRIYKLFKQRNPSFKGSVSLCGHSLGSAVLFDILCHQSDKQGARDRSSSRVNRVPGVSQELGDLRLDFECENFFCLGSPLALFQMLKGRTIAGRSTLRDDRTRNHLSSENEKEARLRASVGLDSNGDIGSGDIMPSSNATVASPKCAQLFNIFHPSDPISYRIEPLISSAMASMKPQPLPYVKRSIWGASGQSLTNISARVGQSMGSLWFNFTSGVASSLLNRSLGLNEGSAATGSAQNQQRDGTDPAAGEKKALDDIKNARSQDSDQNLPTLIDQEIETLYEGFQKRRASEQQDSPGDPLKTPEWLKAEERARKLKTEEAKVRALNSNGRVDYSVQEGAFDISLIASIASHLSYWSDEDVTHFMLSQMLSRARRRQK
ncbi:hypothetical protein FQN54_000953 [Arachnomyces sp. PD_36]|nr:hypothetical protein FQN54_000953 [Arachnomyces sp. PD_36]